MDEIKAPLSPEEEVDIFLCTRELPDKLTLETAALRQLCSALAGEGYRVFFPPALPKDLTDQQKAARIVDALKRAKVMVAAGVGPEGLSDPLSLGLWSAFLKNDGAADRFFLCWRDQGDTPLPAFAGVSDPFDMTDLRFLKDLKEKLAAALPPPAERELPAEPETEPEEPETEPVEPEAEPAEPETEPAEPEAEPEEPEAEPEEPETEPEGPDAEPEEPEAGNAKEKKPFPWIWVLLGAAAAGLVLWLLLR